VRTSPNGSFVMKEFEKEDEAKYIYFIGEHLAIKSPSWLAKEGKL
jgi:hypothetical protein